MQLSAEKNGDVTIVAVNGESLDVSNAEDFRREIAPLLEGCRKLVLDLERVEFVDSRGCGAIISCLKQLSANGGDLRLCQVRKPVRTVFELIRLHRICALDDTREASVRAFQG
jgi:anti-sigma B factor antagonist